MPSESKSSPRMVVRQPRVRWAIIAGSVLLVTALGVIAVALLPGGGTADRAPEIARPDPGGVAGYVFQDFNANGEQDAGEFALSGVTVRLLSTGPLPLETAETDEEGVFAFSEIEHITAGEESVRLRVTPMMEGPATEGVPEDSVLSQEFTAPLGEIVAIPAASFRSCLALDECAGAQLPDLVPLLEGEGDEYPAPTETLIDTEELPGRKLLRFATSTSNEGGLFHVVAAEVEHASEEGGLAVQQRVYGQGGVYVHDAGTFVYHPMHNHFHVDDFVAYELLSEDQAAVVAASGKVSFCLTDVLKRSDRTRPDGEVFLDLPPFECGVSEQGINSGYGDYYGRELPDQWIDVTDVPAGKYWVRITVDPRGLFLESDTSNNMALFPVTIP